MINYSKIYTFVNFIIFFEGIDKVGKTTLINEFHKRTNYKYITVDRGPISFKVYNKMKSRNHNVIYNPIITEVPAIYVCLTANKDDLKERFKKHNETDIPLDEISEYLNTFEKEAFEFIPPKHSKKILLNTSRCTIDEAVNTIIEAIT